MRSDATGMIDTLGGVEIVVLAPAVIIFEFVVAISYAADVLADV